MKISLPLPGLKAQATISGNKKDEKIANHVKLFSSKGDDLKDQISNSNTTWTW